MLSETELTTGLWDLARGQVSLGGLLIMATELALLNEGLPANLCLLGDINTIRPACDISTNTAGISQVTAKVGSVLSAIQSLSCIARLIHSPSIIHFANYIENQPSNPKVWPGLENFSKFQFISTVQLQQLCSKTHKFPRIKVKKDLQQKVARFIHNQILPSTPIAIHLKNSPRDPLSNADQEVWYKFFKAQTDLKEVIFILIGSEDISPDILSLPNVVSTKELMFDLLDDLVFIEMCCIFLGMSAGPCQMAIFSDLPYLIFKHPDHHTEEMKKELGNRDGFTFAKPNQKIIRCYESFELLSNYFKQVFTEERKNTWRENFLLKH